VALNFQTDDNWMQLNEALFADNGGCGYVLKPSILRDPSLKFDPYDLNSMRNKKVLELKIISAQNLPRPQEVMKEISDPFVTVHVYGVPADYAEQKTNSVKDNGLNPIWNENIKFVINCPELAFVKFVVKDQDIGKDQTLGYFVIRFENIRQGKGVF
jgi:Ca2+-dependent lipid-binding protein